jgi:hypothetical protein
MSFRENRPSNYHSGVTGAFPADWFGTDAIDGDAGDFATSSPGYSYMRRDLTNNLATLPRYKTHASLKESDWTGLQCVAERVTVSQFTDGGSTSGTYALKTTIPIGAWIQQTILQDVVGFAGDTTATLTVGDGSDVDRYNTGTPSVFTTANAIDMGVPSGTKIHVAAATVTLTVTTGSDFGLTVTNGNGALTIKIFYLI